MVTRSKSGIHKPKIQFSFVTYMDLPSDNEPISYTEAHKNVNWQIAMSQEFEALQFQGT